MPSQPDTTTDPDDPGDATLQRYRYQATYAARIAVSAIDTHSGIDEVFCELHEDILIRTTNGQFRGVQIKTRESHLPAFGAGDEEILNAIARFVRLDRRFPGAFISFTIGTNHRFVAGSKTKNCLGHLIDLARSNPTDKLLEPFVKKIQKALRGKQRGKKRNATNPPSSSEIISVLSRINLRDDLPQLAGVQRDLCDAIGNAHPDFGAAGFQQITAAAGALTQLALLASSRGDVDANHGYAYVEGNADGEQRNIIDGKRISRATVEMTIRGCIAPPASLLPANAVDPDALSPDSVTLMERKLIAGNLSATTVGLAGDLRRSTQVQALQWMAKFGDAKGREHYHHVSTMVLSECSAAAEASNTLGGVDGRGMYTRLRAGLATRLGDPDVLGSSLEHLLGHAFILTAQCKVWWSAPFDVGSDK